MKRLLMALMALAMVFALTGGALAEGLEIAYENVEALVPEVEVTLAAPNDGDDDEDEPEVLLPVDAANFPDGVFRAYISGTYDMNQDGYLDEDELDYADAVSVDGLGVTSLKGIELLYNLAHLSCAENKGLTAIDVRQNDELEFFNCTNCGLTALSVKGLDALETLYCSGNPLTVLDLEGCESLVTLGGGDIPTLQSLVLKDCESLVAIDCAGTGITTLDLSGCESLISVCVNGCGKLSSVNLKDAEELVQFLAMSTAITGLDVSENTELRFLVTIGCDIERIDISECDALISAVKKNEPVCDGNCTHFGAGNTSYRSDIGTLTGYPIDVMSTTKLIVDDKVVYEPKFSLSQTKPLSIEIDQTTQLEAVFSPAGMAHYGTGKVTWTSSKSKIASVDANGVVKGLKKGKTTITATSPWGATASVKVNVTLKQPTGIKLNKKGTVTLKKKNAVVKLKATLTPRDAEKKVTWTSSVPKVATVDKKGKVKAVSEGETIVTATTGNGLSASVKIVVKYPKKK